MRKQSGFTLVEISIVLVIISLILGSAIYGAQALIANSRATGTAKLVTDLSGAVRDFKARFFYLPGDLPNAGAYIPQISTDPTYSICNIQPGTGSIGDGLIDTPTKISCVTAELVFSGFVKGDPAGIISSYAGHPDVTVRWVNTSKVYGGNSTAYPPSVKSVIEIASVPCDAATAIDLKIDDGDTTKGNVMSSPPCTAGASGVPATTTLDVGL